MNSILDMTKSWVTKNAEHLVYARIAPERTDIPASPPIEPYRGYVRLFLADMFLTKSRAWFTERYPAVSATVRLDLEGRAGATISAVARPPEGMLTPGVRVNYPLTDLLPFCGNLVEIDMALLALKGERYLDTALGLLESLSTLLPGPASVAAGLAEKIAANVVKLLDEGDGAVHLGLHDAFGSRGGANPLRSGYLAVLLASPEQISPASLGVNQNRLYSQAQDGSWSPVQSCDYMLFYVETRVERDNWRLPAIQSAVDKAVEVATLEPGPKADAFKKAAIIAALASKELTPLDRRRVAQAVKQELDGLADVVTFGEVDRSIGALVRGLDSDAGVPTEEALLA